MVEVRKKPRETTASLIRRFSRAVQTSGLLDNAKSKRFYRKPKTARQEKQTALMREHLRNLRRKLEKMGKYDEETFEKEKQKLKQELGL